MFIIRKKIANNKKILTKPIVNSMIVPGVKTYTFRTERR
ncbi:hypothetical protein LEP1GSC041_2550 [Leptospira noguchii str. 2006001870]|nr:hypothetical protein LEP1GSC041_2550 [Leptospira noguchii str. 2006001870]